MVKGSPVLRVLVDVMKVGGMVRTNQAAVTSTYIHVYIN